MTDATNAIDEILDCIIDAIAVLEPKEQIMVLCTIAEHCKAYDQTVLAHEYHAALYGRNKVSE